MHKYKKKSKKSYEEQILEVHLSPDQYLLFIFILKD